MQFALDDLGVLLSLSETILLLFGIAFFIWATHSIFSDKLLHINVRIILCIILSRSVLIPVRRLPTLYWRVFIVGEDVVPFVSLYGELTMFTSNLLCTSLLVLSMERLLHTHVKSFSRSPVIGKLAVLGTLIASNGLLFVQRRLWPSLVISIGMMIATPVVAFIV
ncbi:hypothetical protein PENTCL1PPCAC_16212, partial [Pristionchus entomophagus]